MILVYVLTFFGCVLIAGSMATAYWLASLSCAMHAACNQSGGELFIDILFSLIGIVFWATLALGVYMVWWGFRIKSHHL